MWQENEKDSKERMLYCESCHNMEFLKICPAVIIGVTDGDKILMSKYAGRTYKSMHCWRDLRRLVRLWKRQCREKSWKK